MAGVPIAPRGTGPAARGTGPGEEEESAMSGLKGAMPALVLAGLAGIAFTATGARWDDDDEDEEEIELDEARVFIEWNSTDTDFGIHVFWDGEAWKEMEVENPDGKTVLSVKAKRNLKAQGLTEGFFESDEPPASELSMEEFFERHPEGTYEFEGETLEGDELVGEAEFSHRLPKPPTNLSPATGDLVSHAGFTVSFDPVTEDLDGEEIEIAYYEVVVEKEEDEPILQTFNVILRPSVHSVTVPASFLEPDTEYKIEVIAVLEEGNRTITETGAFSTDGP
jgi:hypothetical protein